MNTAPGNTIRFAGSTLFELLITLAVAGILLAVAIATFRTLVLNNRQSADVNALVAAIHAARSESSKRNAPIVLCQTNDLQGCSPDPAWEGGWVVSANDEVLLAHQPAMVGTIRATRPFFGFRSAGGLGVNGTVTFCDERGAASARAVLISHTGRPQASDRGAGGQPLTCP